MRKILPGQSRVSYIIMFACNIPADKVFPVIKIVFNEKNGDSPTLGKPFYVEHHAFDAGRENQFPGVKR